MNNIKAIAFDLVGVLVKENNYSLSGNEKLLESKFGIINNNSEFYQWATQVIHKPKKEIELMLRNIVLNIYELRELNYDQLPPFKLAIASNHLSIIHDWINQTQIRH